MTPADLDAVVAVAEVVHPAFPEDRSVFANRLDLFAEGCMALDRGAGVEGYLLSHPALLDAPPPLDTCLAALPGDADCYYVHDLALLPACRGTGAGRAAVALAAGIAARHGLARMALIAVNDSGPFWRGCGFVPRVGPDLASYGVDAMLMVREPL